MGTIDILAVDVGEVVQICWEDAINRECKPEKAKQLGSISRKAYGEYFGQSQDMKSIIICPDVCDTDDPDGKIQEFIIIPKGCITEVRRLKDE